MVDRVAGLHVVYAITTALYARERDGEGQHVEVPMFESVAHFVLADHMAGRRSRRAQRASREPGRRAWRAGYDRLLSRTAARTGPPMGYLCVLIYNDKHWRTFLERDRATGNVHRR